MALKLSGTIGADTIRGGSIDDEVYGLGGADSLSGGGGNDSFVFASAAQLAALAALDGGDGQDTLLLGGNAAATLDLSHVRNLESLRLTGTSALAVTFAAGSEQAFTSGIVDVATTRATKLVLNGSLIGSGGRLNVTGTTGNDILMGGAGNDSFAGLGGADVLMGGAGDDLFILNSAAALTKVSRIDGGSGVDVVRVDADVQQTIALGRISGIEKLELAGTGVQAVVLTAQAAAFDDNLASITALKAVSLSLDGHVLVGGNSRMKVEGSHGNDSIIGSGNADTINGHGGADSLLGGAGDDLFIFDTLDNLLAAARVDGQNGMDAVQVTGAASGILSAGHLSHLEALSFTGTGDIALTLGASLPSAFTANAVSIEARSAASLTLDAGALGKASSLVAVGGAGNDRFVAGAGTDSFTGGSGDDTFSFIAGDGTDAVTDFRAHTVTAPVTTVMTFDDLGYNSNGYVGSIYDGFSLSNFYFTSSNYNGYISGAVVSGLTAATVGTYYPYSYGSVSESSTIYRSSSFDFTEFYSSGIYTYSYGNYGHLTLTGYNGAGVQVASASFNIYSGANHMALGEDFHNVSTVVFRKDYGAVGLDNITLRDTTPAGEIAHDRIQFAGMTQAQVEAILATAGEVNGDAHLFYNDGVDQVVLRGVSVAQLSLTDFAWG